jgi:hypothetical protein
MNHRTPIETFRATLASMSRAQLEEAMHYLRGYDSYAMERALELATMPATEVAAGFRGTLTVWQQEMHAEIRHIAIGDEDGA